ncbi:PAS domain S-box protein, partial [Ochrobactrum sp. MR34]|nr:PAS domain S-box protein [Ochrobactrum sp. MR34]
IWSGEICNRNKSGSIYWVETTIVPHINAKGKVDSYTSIRFDITPKKQIEEELKANKIHLNDLANIDSLSGLANRRKFYSYLSECIEISSSKNKTFYLA